MAEAQEPLKVGLVGAAGRGGSFRSALEANGARIHAVCDVDKEALQQCAKRMGASRTYTDHQQMLDDGELDAVVIGTPMQFHVPQSIAALQRNVHVLCEVPAGVSMDECRQLVKACAASKAIYMMAENYTYMQQNVLVRSLAQKGLFGEMYYAEGEYLHELKGLNEITTWRRKWQTGIEGNTYVTHSLGPILQWMAGDRVVRVSCEGSGHHHKDPRGENYHSESPVMLCKTAKDGLIKLRLDMISDRPHAMTNYQLQGKDGAYESSRGGPGDRDKIWLRALSKEPRWFDLWTLAGMDDFAEKYMPHIWRNPPEAARRAGHGGGDYFEVMDFINAVRGAAPCPIGIHEAMDMTLPGLASQQSILEGGRWVWVPDSRSWTSGRHEGQLHMIWPQRLLDKPPEVALPEGYELRQFRDADVDEYLALMHRTDLAHWDHKGLANLRPGQLPGGFFIIFHKPSGKIVASAQARHAPSELHPEGGEVGWVVADPDHKGKQLGLIATAAAVRRLLSAGYRHVYLSTDDWRLPACKSYLKLGFEPMMYKDDMPDRWKQVKQKLAWTA